MSSIEGRRIIAMDCEMVEGVDRSNILARVSIVDYFGNTILDSFVSSEKEIGDYRTPYSGVTEWNLFFAPSFLNIQKKVREIISNKILVGYNLQMDLNVLGLQHPIQHRRDIGKSIFIVEKYGNSMQQSVSLRKLTFLIFNRQIQVDGPDSMERAVASLNIYKHYKNQIENEINGIVGEHGSFEGIHFRTGGSEVSEVAEVGQTSGLAANLAIATVAVGSAVLLFNLFTRNSRND